MGTVIAVSLSGIQTLVDSDTPTVPLTHTYATAPGGVMGYFHNAWLAEHGPVLEGITDAGSGIVVSGIERDSFHSHTNIAAVGQLTEPTAGELQYVLTATSTGVFSWQPTQVNHTHSLLSVLETIPSPSAGQEGYALVGVAGGGGYEVIDVTAFSDPNHRGVYVDLAALAAAIPTGTAGNYAILTNAGGPASFGVWDSDAAPAAWVDTGASTGVLSVNGDVGPAVTFDSDDIAEGSTNLFLTSAERVSVATIGAMTTGISDNVTAIGLRLLTSTWTAAAASDITDSGSNEVITVAERASIAEWVASEGRKITNAGSNIVMSVAERAALDKLRTPGVGATGYLVQATGEGLDAWDWVAVPAGGVGTVTSVNSQSPVTGNVTINAGHIDPTAARLWLTALERSSISTTADLSAANQTLLARNGTRQTLASSGTLTWDADLGVKAMTTMDGNGTLPLVTNGTAADALRVIVTQDAIGGRTLNTSAYRVPGGTLELSTDPNAIDILSVEWVSDTVQYLVKVPNLS